MGFKFLIGKVKGFGSTGDPQHGVLGNVQRQLWSSQCHNLGSSYEDLVVEFKDIAEDPSMHTTHPTAQNAHGTEDRKP